MPTRHEVAQFLREFKTAIDFHPVKWVPRTEDRQHLINLGITQNIALELIRGLTPDNYSKGPEPDDTKPDRDIWVFGCEVNVGIDAYIKLALQPHNSKKHVTYGLIWAFHKPDFRMKYPLKEDESQ